MTTINDLASAEAHALAEDATDPLASFRDEFNIPENADGTQQALFNAQDNQVVARLARLQAVLNLYQALGGAWMPPEKNGAINASR